VSYRDPCGFVIRSYLCVPHTNRSTIILLHVSRVSSLLVLAYCARVSRSGKDVMMLRLAATRSASAFVRATRSTLAPPSSASVLYIRYSALRALSSYTPRHSEGVVSSSSTERRSHHVSVSRDVLVRTQHTPSMLGLGVLVYLPMCMCMVVTNCMYMLFMLRGPSLSLLSTLPA